MQTTVGNTRNIGAALPDGMTDEDLARKNLAEANQVNALKFNGATAAFSPTGQSTGGANSQGILGSITGGALGAAEGWARGQTSSSVSPKNPADPGPKSNGILSTQSTQSTQSPVQASPPSQLGLPASWKITPDQTVEGRINNLTDPNNPLIQQARSRADGNSNARGLLNSSMALTAADSAAYDAAMPIAQADAANASKVAGYNADQQNQFSLANMSNQTNRYGIDSSANTQRYSTDTASTTQRYIADQNTATQMTIKKLDQAHQTQLTQLELKSRELLQNSQVASNAYGTYAQTLYNNSINKDMTPQARYLADQNAYHLYEQQLSLSSRLIGTPDVSSLLNFTRVDPDKPKDPPAATTVVGGGNITPPPPGRYVPPPYSDNPY